MKRRIIMNTAGYFILMTEDKEVQVVNDDLAVMCDINRIHDMEISIDGDIAAEVKINIALDDELTTVSWIGINVFVPDLMKEIENIIDRVTSGGVFPADVKPQGNAAYAFKCFQIWKRTLYAFPEEEKRLTQQVLEAMRKTFVGGKSEDY